MAVSTTITMDLTSEMIHVKVAPRQPYSPPALKIASRYGDVEFLLEEEQLAEIGYAIQQYLEAIRYHETPDQQLILNHEYEEGAHETHRAS